MVRLWLGVVGLFALSAIPAVADGWVFVNEPSEYKLGHSPSGAMYFHPVWFQCDAGKALMSGYYSNRRAPNDLGNIRLSGGGDDVTISGSVQSEDVGLGFWMEAKLDRSHAVFRMIASGQPLTYQPSGQDAQRLSSTGQAANVNRFWAACR